MNELDKLSQQNPGITSQLNRNELYDIVGAPDFGDVSEDELQNNISTKFEYTVTDLDKEVLFCFFLFYFFLIINWFFRKLK